METEQIPYFHSGFLEEKITFWILLPEAWGLFDIKHKCYQVRLAAAILKIRNSLADGRVGNVLVAPGPWQFMWRNGPTEQPSWLSSGFTFLLALTDCPVICYISQFICLSCVCLAHQERWWCLGDPGSDFNPLTEVPFSRTGRQPTIS